MKMDTTAQHLKLGKWLKNKRKAAKMTESQLAAIIGRPPSFIQKYEAGSRLELGDLVEVAVALKASLQEAVAVVEGKGGKRNGPGSIPSIPLQRI
jgi:transcriptional regulator with XRE-family HTH domain